MYKVYCTWDQSSYATPLLATGKFELVFDYDEADVILFTGGEDVDPSVYNEPKGKYTHSYLPRDLHEMTIAAFAKAKRIPMIGVCRGSQFLCALAGGSLVQHITGHGGNHKMTTKEGRSFLVSSTHHQMQNPPSGSYLLGWSAEKLSSCYLDGNNTNLDIQTEVEAVYYPKINAFTVQYHPEYMYPDSDGVQWFQEKCLALVSGELKNEFPVR